MQNFEEEYKKLNAQQRRAVNCIEGPLLVVAGPGTGKTQLLSMRVANILRHTDEQAGNILCLTYTESGQAAMRARLQKLIGDSSKQVQIHTFHGFGTHLITHYDEFFPELRGFRAADDLALYETLRGCFEKLPPTNPLAKQAYGQFIYQKAALGRISQLKQAGFTPTLAKAKVQDDLAWCSNEAKKLTKAFTATGRLSPKTLPTLKSSLEPILVAPAATDSLAETCLQELKAALSESDASGKMTALSAFKKQWFSSEDSKLYFKPADQLAKLAALADLYELYETALKHRKLFDYDDMLLYALEQLESSADLRATLQETYHYILADEYQDTNATQVRILELIADNPVNEGRPNVMVVGDDDQAIYGFQGALGEALVHFRERWRDVTTVTLGDNYRSTQPILDTARNVITHGKNRLENYYEDIDKTLQARAGYPPKLPEAVQLASHQALVDYAAKLAQNATGEVAIIAPRHKYLAELAAKLDANGVAYRYAGRENLLDDETVMLALLVAETALAIKQDHETLSNMLLPQLFASDALGVSRISAWRIAVDAQAKQQNLWHIMQSVNLPDVVRASQRLQQLAEGLETTNALATLRQAAVICGNKRGLRPKLRALCEHAKTYLNKSTIDLRELLNYVELCRQADVALAESVEYGTPEAPVRLLTAHKSKGLEFEQVIVLHADSFTWLEQKGQRNIIGLPPNWAWLQPATETRDDRLRLAYVVLTRAKHGLHILRSANAPSGKPTEPLPGIETLLTVSPKASETEAQVNQEAIPHWYDWYLPTSAQEQQALKQLLQARLQNLSLSPSTLSMFLDIGRGGPASFLVKALLAIPTPVPSETRFGNNVHSLLRYVQETLNKTGKVPNTAMLKKHITTITDVPPAEANHAVATVVAFIKETDTIQPGGVPEYSFTDQHLRLNGVPITGTIDRYDQTGGKLTITDYKTGRALDSWQISEDYYKQKLWRFRQQLLFYEALFRTSPKFKTVDTIDLKIAFVEPRKRGGYSSLTLSTNTDERLQLEALIKIIWDHIQEMNFPATTPYTSDTTGINSFITDLLANNI